MSRYEANLSTFEDGGDESDDLKELLARKNAARPSTTPSTPPSNLPSPAASGTPSTPASSGSTVDPEPVPRKATSRRRKPTSAVRRSRSGGAARARRDQDPDQPIARILYVPENLFEPISVYRARHHVTNTVMVLQALNAYHSRLEELLAEDAERTTPAATSSGLFTITAPAERVPNRQLEITPTLAQLEVIDQLVANCSARDRSHMASVCIRRLLSDDGLT